MYWKTKLDVPKGIRYLSEWDEFQFTRFTGHNIIHKQIPGCGFTEYALTSSYPVVLCSPRKMLMKNKKDQHGDDVFLVVSEFDRSLEVDENITKAESDKVAKDKIEEFRQWLKDKVDKEETVFLRLKNELIKYLNKLHIDNNGKCPKIIVTYDSAYLIRKILDDLGVLNKYWFVVDEFQSLLEDARFKADTENNFLGVLQTIPNVLYVSATPMLDKYIQKIPELNLPYYELDWSTNDLTRIKKPDLKVRTMKSVGSKMDEIIQSYLGGNFERVIVDRNGRLEEVVSDECVMYVNSVNHIINAIKRNDLTPDQVNILCSDTSENQRRIDRSLGKNNRFKIGSVPLRGEKHKMFTFCTRTVYLGADFYSLCARSFIFSDSNSDCLSVDISMDLAQILGRQRLDENPWRNSAEFYYKTTADYKKMTWESLRSIIDKKLEVTNSLIRSYNSTDEGDKDNLAKLYRKNAQAFKYRDDYVSVNTVPRDNNVDELLPVINNLVIINEERTFDIQQVDYASRFSVFCSIEREFSDGIGIEGDVVKKFFKYYEGLVTYIEKSKAICEYLIDNPFMRNSIIANLSDHDKIKQQLISIGPEKMKGLGYNLTRINQAMGIVIFDKKTLDDTIYSTFLVGERYTKKYIKEKLGEIYKAADFHGTPKSNDLENWFKLKNAKIPLPGKREAGFEIISRK